MLFEFLVGQVFPEYRDRSVISIGSFEAISEACVNLAVANFVAADDNSGNGAAAATGAGNLEGADLATFSAITDVTTLAADFTFI